MPLSQTSQVTATSQKCQDTHQINKKVESEMGKGGTGSILQDATIISRGGQPVVWCSDCNPYATTTTTKPMSPLRPDLT